MSKARYQDWQVVGKGAYGTVYKVKDTKTLQTAAVKVTDLPAAAEKQGAWLLERIGHPACPRCIECFEDGTCFYLVMTFFEGVPLSKVQGLSVKKTVQLALEMLDVMERLNKLGMTYNDFKPDNIMINEQQFYLVDFGSVLFYHSPQARFGSVAFASPEYLSGRPIDWRSDLYSLAKTMAVLCLNPDWRLRHWLKKALRKEPSQRFQTVSEAKKALLLQPRIGIAGCVLSLLLMGFWPLVQDACYEACLNHDRLAECMAIDSSRKEAFEAYLATHDWQQTETWIVLNQMGLKQVEDEAFLLNCTDCLCELSSDFTWTLQKELLSNMSCPAALQRLSLMENKHFEDFTVQNLCPDERRFFYYLCVSTKKEADGRLYAWIEKDTHLKAEEKMHLLAKTALKLTDEKKLKDCFTRLDDIDDACLKAAVAYQIFELGYYDEGWLHQARQLLENTAEPDGRELLGKIDMQIAQWGENA